MVPPFSESKVAVSPTLNANYFKWPKETWTLLEHVLTGKAEDVYVSYS